MISYEEALARIASLERRDLSEELPLRLALGRTLAEAVRMDRDQPPFDRATMDGYALIPGSADRYRVLGTRAAGSEAGPDPKPGEALRIMTGAPCPPGVAVVPHERTAAEGDVVSLLDDPLPVGANIARRGEDARQGAPVLLPGAQLDALGLAAAAMAGAVRVRVRVKIVAAILTTGDEVAAAGPAGIADSNGPLLLGLAQALGCTATQEHLPDEAEALRRAIAGHAERADLLITTGGVSAGDRDLVPAAAEAAGFRQVFHKVAIQPGKPVLLCRREGDHKLLVGLPGNPVSVLATTHLILWPLLARLGIASPPPWLELPLSTAHEHRGQRRLFLPGRFEPGGLAPIPWNGSGDLLAAASGDGLIDFAIAGRYEVGTRVRFLPYLGALPGARARLDRPPRHP